MPQASASLHVNKLVEAGYLENLERDPNRPRKRLVLGDPLPDHAPPLPSPCEVSAWLADHGSYHLIIPWVDPISGKLHDCATHDIPTARIEVQGLPPDFCGTVEPLACAFCCEGGSTWTEPLEPSGPVAAGVQAVHGVQQQSEPHVQQVQTMEGFKGSPEMADTSDGEDELVVKVHDGRKQPS